MLCPTRNILHVAVPKKSEAACHSLYLKFVLFVLNCHWRQHQIFSWPRRLNRKQISKK